MKTWTLDRGQIKDENGDVLASFPYAIGGKEDWQNARMVLNAPEMFELLQEAVSVIQSMETINFDWARKEDLLHDIVVLLGDIETVPECSRKSEDKTITVADKGVYGTPLSRIMELMRRGY